MKMSDISTCESLFKTELATYEAHRDELKNRIGKFVLIQGDSILGSWDSYEDALKSGYETFGVDTPFLVKKIEGLNGIQYFTRDISACQASPQASMPSAQSSK